MDIVKRSELQKLRDATHYGILSKVSARDVKQMKKFFEFLPLVKETISEALSTLKQIYPNTGKRLLSSLSDRITDLFSSLSTLEENYQEK